MNNLLQRSAASGNQTERNCGYSTQAGCLFQCIDQNGFQSCGIKIYQASGNLLVACAVEAQLTNTDSARLAADRRTKAPASDRSRGIEIATSGLPVERRTCIVIAEVRKLSGLSGSVANSTCALGIAPFQLGQAIP
jgi:hypothetical protein